MESIMMDYMYNVPSDESITEINITKEIAENNLKKYSKKDLSLYEVNNEEDESKKTA